MQNSKIKKKIITLIGPTACNKTSTAVHLIKKFPISIIGVDSVQIYKRFNIGSAKPTKEILEKYKHHLVDSIDPENIFSVKDFYDQAYRIVMQAHSNNRIPLLVGGTMMYFNALFKGINDIPEGNEAIREELQRELDNIGVDKLFNELKEIDPESAKTIKKNDKQRIMRALEVFRISGKKISDFKKKDIKNIFEEFEFINLGIFPIEREILQASIRERIAEMVNMGLIKEAQEIIKLDNIAKNHPALNSINYKEAIQVINGELDANELEEKCAISTRQLVKRQLTWMRSFNFSKTFDINSAIEIEKYLEEQIF
ncbi:tRNA (adenosine(37)-N6)-dimethylallyltransferase MiaA [Pseudomonadota bacterium]|nr:tRNA (adenosine(37)-N6)-dimethylallyltransferase MiaA [Pseudomonadota bacterium]